MNYKHFFGSRPYISKEDAKWRAVSYSINMLRRTFLPDFTGCGSGLIGGACG